MMRLMALLFCSSLLVPVTLGCGAGSEPTVNTAPIPDQQYPEDDPRAHERQPGQE